MTQSKGRTTKPMATLPFDYACANVFVLDANLASF